MCVSGKIFDIAIIGGGLNGLTQALAFARMFENTSPSIALIDRGAVDLVEVSQTGGRAFALTSSSRNMLQKLGIWDDIEASSQPMSRIKVTDSKLGDKQRPILLHFDHDQDAPGSMSYMVEHAVLQNALIAKIRKQDAIEIFTHEVCQLNDLSSPLCDVELQKSKKTIKARLIVAADGKNSPARNHAGIKTYGWSYDQTGIVTTIRHDTPHNGVAEEHFLPAGPFAILPLTGNRASLVWTEKTASAERLLKLDDDTFKAEIAKRFGDHLGAIEVLGGRAGFPLSLFLAEKYYKGRLALIGDSAHVVHPIAGLGLNLGFRDIAALTDVVKEALQLGLDFGAEDALERYQTWRRFDNVSVALATDGLNRLFSNDHEAIRHIRDIGLKAVDRVDPLKKIFMQEASGLVGDIPSLMQK